MASMNETNKHTWCVNAERGLSIGTNGDARICCMVESELKDDTGKPFNVETSSIADIFNSTEVIRVRQNLRLGIKDPGCKKCWNEEDAGRASKRVRDIQFKKFVAVDIEDRLKILELNLGNTCNVKCRTCGPWSSSQWIREYYDTKYERKADVSYEGFAKQQTRYTALYDSDSPFWDGVFQAAPDLEHLDFYGGEPFLIKKQWELITHCAEKGYAKNQILHYNTNTTIWPKDHIETFKKFKLLDLSFSIDGINEQANYIRYPTEWETVDENVNRWYMHNLENPENTKLSICMTLSPMNIFYMDRMFDYVDRINEKYSSDKLSLYLNLVHRPEYYNISYLPDYFKTAVTEKYKDIHHRNWLLQGIIQFMNNGSHDEEIWKQFKYYTKAGDEYRNQSFKEFFPEVYQLMEENNDVEGL